MIELYDYDCCDLVTCNKKNLANDTSQEIVLQRHAVYSNVLNGYFERLLHSDYRLS